jgi:hypothetical protein
MDSSQVVFVTWMVLIWGTGIPGLLSFIWFRQSAVIRVRGFWSVLLQMISLIMWASDTLVSKFSGTPMPSPLAYFFLFVNVCFLMERSVMLLITFRISTQSVQRAQDKFMFNAGDELEDRTAFQKKLHQWLLANRRYFHQGLFSWSKMCALGFAGLWTVPSVLAYNSLPSDAANKISNTTLNLFYVIVFIVMGVCSHYIRRVQENFKIKTELAKIAVMVVIVIFVLATVTFLTNWSQTQPVIINSIYMSLIVTEIWLSLIRIVLLANGIPLSGRRRKSSGYNRAFSSHTQANEMSKTSSQEGEVHVDPLQLSIAKTSHNSRLVTMLEDEVKVKKFEKFLIREFAVEGLLFWRAVANFKKNFAVINQENAKQARAAAEAIYAEFCAIDAQMCINISSQCRRTLLQVFRSQELVSNIQEDANIPMYVKPDTFDEAVKETLMLLAQDSFRRFVRELKDENKVSAQPTSQDIKGQTATVELPELTQSKS